MRVWIFLALMLLASHANAQQSPSGWPVTIVETPDQPSHVAEREKQSDAHDASGLDAQERAANAAERSAATSERQEVPAWAQIIIGIASTIIAVIALVVSLFTAVASIRTTRIQLRAYLSAFDFDTVISNQNTPPHIVTKITFKNSGQTPARNVVLNIWWEVGTPPFDEGRHDNAVLKVEGRGSIPAGMPFYGAVRTSPTGPDRIVSQEDIEQIVDGNLSFWIFGVIEYDDVFGRSHRSRFRYVMNVGTDNIATFSPCAAGNDET
ncbi:MAG: hypothetical protein EOS03_23865 [Mesorhizobium sp.]|uniref:hypothetical protein n=1 Tax=Mesorhizobium sp. TaxID=1871066 RepID=UPI000FE6A494|nr:hypothetical protein [Mesorhizobium sp.]RWN44686.1 MAG: hypothetical protein EOS03_23865 [Mesorhizobium sp.]